jgi:hypothetical protein
LAAVFFFTAFFAAVFFSGFISTITSKPP